MVVAQVVCHIIAVVGQAEDIPRLVDHLVDIDRLAADLDHPRQEEVSEGIDHRRPRQVEDIVIIMVVAEVE